MFNFEEMEEGKIYTSIASKETKVFKRRGVNLFYRYTAKTTARKMWSVSYANRNQKNYIPRVAKDRGFMGLGGMPV
tara:strand:+ start:310 stop:537 length:228 start_codon:yes stop_codon:yes gene_type:complete